MFGSGVNWDGTAPSPRVAPSKRFWGAKWSTFEHNFLFLEPLRPLWNQSKQEQIESGAARFYRTSELNANQVKENKNPKQKLTELVQSEIMPLLEAITSVSTRFLADAASGARTGR